MLRLILGCSFLLLAFNGQSEEAINQQIINKIATSKQQLNQLENQINNSTLSYQNKINKALNEVKALRKQAAAIQRVADEQTLSVEKLADRVVKWQAQDNYQKLLLQSYFEQKGELLSNYRDSNGDLIISDSLFSKLESQLTNSLIPSWQQSQIVDDMGQVNQFNRLDLGPVSLAFNADINKGGLIEHGANQAMPNLVKGVYNDQDIAQLQQLKQTGLAQITFDPTLGNAAKLQQNKQGLISHIEKGGVWAFPILFFGGLSLIVALIKSIQLFSLPKVRLDFIDRVKQHVVNDTSYQQLFSKTELQLIDIAKTHPISDKRDDQLVAFLMRYRYQVENYLGIVATSAAIAPLLGLLGTVSGMINTFMMMNTFGTGDAATVSGGISEALVTTELGLIVAIPSLILSALLSRKAKSHNARLETSAVQLSKHAF